MQTQQVTFYYSNDLLKRRKNKCSTLKAHSIYLFVFLVGKEVSQALFFGEDFHIPMPAGKADVSFKPSISPRREKSLMRSGEVVDLRAKLNTALTHLILENVGESDEGVYTITSDQTSEDVTRIILYVRGTASFSCQNTKKWFAHFEQQLAH